MEHVTCKDYLNEAKKKEIDKFNETLNSLLDNRNFHIDGNGKFDSMYLDDIDDNPIFNPGVAYPGIKPTAEDYGDMIVEE